jgi:formamidopyrimidine-DNA glycosylase
MPELPEVETISRQLRPFLKGKIIVGVDINLAKQIKGSSAASFSRQISQAKIIDVGRRAKMLIFKTNKAWLVFHLKMTGQLIFAGKGALREGGPAFAKAAERRHPILRGGGHPIKGSLENLPNRYSHIIFKFKDGSRLFFNDQRQFGWVSAVGASMTDVEKLSATPLGPEPLTSSFNFTGFAKCLRDRPNSRIYQALLDQKCVVGVGNIYVNESLHYAGIRPKRRCKNIKTQEYKKLYTGINKILKKSIAVHGTTIGHYMDALGDFGKFSRHLKVYGRERKKCLRKDCPGMVQRIKIGGRSAFYCSQCQK